MREGWRVHVEHQPMGWSAKLYLYRRAGMLGSGEMDVVCRDGTVTRVPAGAETPESAGIEVPADAWEALVEYAAAQSHAGAVNGVLREWLKVESGRVDGALGRGSGNG
jgi:hypothetical protein